jgi:hypothetical protein
MRHDRLGREAREQEVLLKPKIWQGTSTLVFLPLSKSIVIVFKKQTVNRFIARQYIIYRSKYRIAIFSHSLFLRTRRLTFLFGSHKVVNAVFRCCILSLFLFRVAIGCAAVGFLLGS